MKKKFVFTAVTIVAMFLLLVGCGIKVTKEKWGRFLN